MDEREQILADIRELVPLLRAQARATGPNWQRTLASVLAGLALLAVGGLSAWVLDISQRVTSNTATIIATINAHEARLMGLETGRTTPMAAETRAEFKSVKKSIDKVEVRLGHLADRVYSRKRMQ